jgi:hypothetical protein
MLYAAKCYWPGVTEGEIVARRPPSHDASYVGALLFPNDALVLCLFEAPTPTAVRQATDRAGLPCERVMQTRWLPLPAPTGTPSAKPALGTMTGRRKPR